MNTSKVKLFDSNNKLLPDFDKRIEEILISIHGRNYYDTDEDYHINNLDDLKIEKKVEIKQEIKNEPIKKEITNTNTKNKISFKDFIPLLFFIIIFAIIVFAGYYFLNTFDFLRFVK